MKNRNLEHDDDWMTPPGFYNMLNNEFEFTFDPCPYKHDLKKWDGLDICWGNCNFVNPPYSRHLKEAFIQKAIQESKLGKKSILLLPVSTSTNIFHQQIIPNTTEIRFVHKRIPFIGVNTKGEYVNWHLLDSEDFCFGEFKKSLELEGISCIKNSGMHDSMVVIIENSA